MHKAWSSIEEVPYCFARSSIKFHGHTGRNWRFESNLRLLGRSQLSNPSDLPCCTFADKSLGRNGIELEMQMFPDDLPLANIDADGYCCHFMRSSVRPTIHGLGFVYCIQSAWKKWPTIWHADVSRWLTLSIHGCLWILLLVCLSVHLSVCSFTAFSGGCAFADKSLRTNGIKFDMLMYLLV